MSRTYPPRLVEAPSPADVLTQAVNSWSQQQVPGRPITKHRSAAIVAALEANGVVLAVREAGA